MSLHDGQRIIGDASLGDLVRIPICIDCGNVSIPAFTIRVLVLRRVSTGEILTIANCAMCTMQWSVMPDVRKLLKNRPLIEPGLLLQFFAPYRFRQ